jgi:hypothetical protein
MGLSEEKMTAAKAMLSRIAATMPAHLSIALSPGRY